MHLLPQVSPEDLDEGNLEGGDLAMHENACQVQLHLEAHIHIGTVNGGGPPQRETPVGNLVQTRPLRIGQLLVPTQVNGVLRVLPASGQSAQGTQRSAGSPAQGLYRASVNVSTFPTAALE